MEAAAPQATPFTTLYVLIPPSPLFAAHWSLFLPETLPYDPVSRRHEESTTGRRIHVSGDRLNGFQLEIVRHYDVKEHRSVGTRRFPVGRVSHEHLKHGLPDDRDRIDMTMNKDDEEGGGFIDNNPVDEVEKICIEVEASGPSLNQVSRTTLGDNVATGMRRKTEVKDCQWWVRQVVELLMSRGMLRAMPTERVDVFTRSPTEIVATLPVH